MFATRVLEDVHSARTSSPSERTVVKRQERVQCASGTKVPAMKNINLPGPGCDVELMLNGEVFRSHRSLLAAFSEYFQRILDSDFDQFMHTKKYHPVQLPHTIDNHAFTEFLMFVYTGDLCITDSNVYELLILSDFLELRTTWVEKQCIEHVQTYCKGNSKPMAKGLELFCFACKKGKFNLQDTLMVHLCQNFLHYSEQPILMKMEFITLVAFLKRSKDYEDYAFVLPDADNVRLRIIFDWLYYSYEKRKRYRSFLMRNIAFSNVSLDNVGKMIGKLI